MATPGRNEPCPCGSGRKYKHCCLRARAEEDSLRVRLRSAEGVLVPALFSYAVQEFGEEFFDEAWDEFFLWNDAPEDVHDSREFGTTFDPFFVFAFVPESAEDELPAGWPTEPVALHFLHHEVESAPAFHVEFIEQACKSPASFFVVEAVAPGRSIDVKDIFTGRRFHVLEQSASRSLEVGDLTFTRVVTAGGASILIGACPWVIPASWHIPLIDMRERFRPKGLLTREDLQDYDFELREAYHGIVDALLHPTLPVLQNTDGDPLELTTLTYQLAVSAAEAVERLTPLATLRGETHVTDEARDAAGAIRSATLTWIKAGNRKMKEWDNTTLGTLRIDESRLVVEVNSARRRRRIEKEIAKRLGPAATLLDTSVTDIAEALEDRRSSSSPSVASEEPPDTPPPSPELAAIEAELARRHWEAWFDTKIPALGNKTPRQAARSASGRERLEALLAAYGQHRAGGSNVFEPDVAALKRRLGLT
ncbi:MAG: SEC-C domain-containing protein [Acidobacteriota bacterium]